MSNAIIFSIRAVLGMFFAFWITISGVFILPQIMNVVGVNTFAGFLVPLSVSFSAIFIILYSMGFFDKLNFTKIKGDKK